MIGADLRTFLIAQQPIAAIVADRVEVGRAGQGTPWPRIVLSQVSRENYGSLGGAGDVDGPRWQIDCQAKESATAVRLASAVEEAVDGYLGPMGGTAEVAAWVANTFTDYDAPHDGNDAGVHRVLIDVQMLVEP